METTATTSITEKIISGLKKAAVELEEFRLQAALGKAEAHDAYEKAKKIFSGRMIDFSLLLIRGAQTLKRHSNYFDQRLCVESE